MRAKLHLLPIQSSLGVKLVPGIVSSISTGYVEHMGVSNKDRAPQKRPQYIIILITGAPKEALFLTSILAHCFGQLDFPGSYSPKGAPKTYYLVYWLFLPYSQGFGVGGRSSSNFLASTVAQHRQHHTERLECSSFLANMSEFQSRNQVITHRELHWSLCVLTTPYTRLLSGICFYYKGPPGSD